MTSTWHPILSTVEPTPGCWQLLDDFGSVVGEIKLVKRGREVGYRGIRITENGDRELIGYFTTLLTATKRVHLRVVAGYGHPGPPLANWKAGPAA